MYLAHVTPKPREFQVGRAMCFVGGKERPALAVAGLF